MKAHRSRRRPKHRIATAIFFAIAGIPFCAMVTFVIMLLTGNLARAPIQDLGPNRIRLANGWFDRIDWSTAIYIFIVVYIVSQIMANWHLITDPPGDWFASKRDDGALSITRNDDDPKNEDK